jgi:anthranilate phosphoribosyltransferase
MADWAGILARLTASEDLGEEESHELLSAVLAGDATPAQIGGLLIAYRMKPLTVPEMTGFVRALLDAAVPLDLGDIDAVDTCGTGGSEQRREGAFHVSTLTAFVTAGAGVSVCKHGNRKASATSGSADLLEALGVAIDLGPDGVARCVRDAGMGFCLAPTFHPGMRHPGPVRRELGVRTLFNLVAPLANPARVRRQVVGVADGAMAERLAEVLAAKGTERAMVVYGHDGLDELTTAATSTIVELRDGEVHSYDIDPTELGLATVSRAPEGGDTPANVELARRVLDGEPGPHRDIVVLNAAAALTVGGAAVELADGVRLAGQVIDDGRAAAVLERLVEVSQAASAE